MPTKSIAFDGDQSLSPLNTFSTDHHQLNSSLLSARKRAEQLEKNLNHGMRTPLNAVIGMAYLLFDTPLNEEQQGHLSALLNAAESLHNSISVFLDSPTQVMANPINPKKFETPPPIRSMAAPRSTQKTLVVEDNEMNRRYIGELLRKWQIDYVFAENGVEALEACEKETFALIFMDIQIPLLDGYETARVLRGQKGPNQKTPIVALTASAPVSERSRSIEAGMNSHLSKPFSPKELLEQLQDYLIEPFELPTDTNLATLSALFDQELDRAALLAMYGSDTAYACEMFEVFLEKSAPEVLLLRPALDRAEFEKFAEVVHRIKANFGLVGLSKLQRMLNRLEKEAKSNPEIRVEQLRMSFDLFEKSLPDGLLAVEKSVQKLRNRR